MIDTALDDSDFLTADDLPGETDTSDFVNRDEVTDLIEQAQLEGDSNLYTADELIEFHNNAPVLKILELQQVTTLKLTHLFKT